MPNILDVEFLRNPVPLDRSLIYRFRTGVLRHNLFLALKQMVPLGGCEPSELPHLIRGAGLLDYTYYCNLSSNEHQSSVDAARLLAALSETDSRPIVLFAHARHPLFRSDNWEAGSANCIVIDEVVATGQTLKKILDYLEHASDLLRVDCSDARLARLAYCREILAHEGALRLHEIRNAFDSAVLLHTDPATGEFRAPATADNQPSSRPSLFRMLRDLIEQGNASALSAFLRTAAELHHDGWTARDLTDELCKVTRRLLESRAPGFDASRRPAHDPLAYELGLLIWAAVLLVWTGPLIDNEDREEREPPSVRLFVVLLDQLAREFLLRKDAQEQDDPLAGLWLPLEAAIAAPFRLEFEAPTPRDQLLTTLLSSLPAPAAGDRPWIARLRHILNAPNAQPAKLQQSTAKIRPEWSPASLDQVYGNAVVLRDLRARFESKRHTKPLLLHGAKGIGKRTIARVYARTLLCESRDEESWLACSRCTACRSFDASGNIGLMEFDPANDQTGDIAKEVLSKLSFGLYHRHRIVIIENPERSARAVDTLLKTLEDGVAQTTFVLCVSDLSAISVTGQSRCTHHRVRPLGAVESTALANGMINRLGTKAPDPEAIRLIVAVAEGLPGKLQRICNIVAAAKALSLEDVTRALDLDWIGFILSYWVALVCLQRPASGALTLPPNVDPEKAVQQVRQVLSVLHRTKQLTDTIEVLLTEELGQQRDKIVQLLTERAAELVVPYDELWSRLARHWTSSDHADARAFLQAGLVSRQIIHGSMVDSH